MVINFAPLKLIADTNYPVKAISFSNLQNQYAYAISDTIIICNSLTDEVEKVILGHTGQIQQITMFDYNEISLSEVDLSSENSISENNLDLFIDLNYRSLDIDTNNNNLFSSRIQFPFVRSIILRLNKNDYTMTVHLMRDIDLFSAFANFEVNYKDAIIAIKNTQEKVSISKTLL